MRGEYIPVLFTSSEILGVYKHPDRARNNSTKGFSRDLNTRPFE